MNVSDKRAALIKKVMDAKFTDKELQEIIDKLKEMLKIQNKP